jgi:hypothetical protein
VENFSQVRKAELCSPADCRPKLQTVKISIMMLEGLHGSRKISGIRDKAKTHTLIFYERFRRMRYISKCRALARD